MSEEVIERLPLSKIRIDGDTQPRLEIQEEVVDSYRRDMRKGASFPPVEVVFDGLYYWLCDGFHRFKAARLAHKETLQAIVHQGTQDEAVWRSLAANAAHGLRRTNEDKAWAIGRAVKIRPDRSNRFLADHVGVDHKTVSRLRGDLASTGEIPHLERLRGRDGRWHPAKLDVRPRTGSTGEIPQPNNEHWLSDLARSWQRRRWDGRLLRKLTSPPDYDLASHRLNEPGMEKLREVFDRRIEMERIVKKAKSLQEDILMAFTRRDPLFAHLDWRECDYLMERVLLHLNSILPYSICTPCNGAGCDICGQRGWVHKELYDQICNRCLPQPVELT
jgi:hypothetical protein